MNIHKIISARYLLAKKIPPGFMVPVASLCAFVWKYCRDIQKTLATEKGGEFNPDVG
jgi:hypothetical protein